MQGSPAGTAGDGGGQQWGNGRCPPAPVLSGRPSQEKCCQYWPDQGCWTYGHIRVRVEDCTALVDYTVRKFCVQSVSAPPGVPRGACPERTQGRDS